MAKVQGVEATLANETMTTMRRRVVKEARKADQAASCKRHLFKAMTQRFSEVASSSAEEGGSATDPSPDPDPLERPVRDWSDGVAVHFTKGGQQLRPFPEIINQASQTKRPECDKRQFRYRKHRGDRHTPGCFNLICSSSGVIIGLVMLKDHEGPRTAASLLYCYMPRKKKEKSDDRGRLCMPS